MTTHKEALKLALEALESFAPHNGVFWRNLHKDDAEIAKAITAIKEALSSPNGEAQPEQEPVAQVGMYSEMKALKPLPVGTMLYTTPPQPKEPEQPKVRTGNCLRVGVCASEGHKIAPQRKPLTDEQMDAVIDGCPKYHGRFSTKDPDGKLNYYELIRAIEAAHGIKE